MIVEVQMKFLLNAAYCFVTGHLSCMQTQVRKSAPSRARSQGGRWNPQRRPPILLSSRCPVPAAATPPLNPGHPAPFSAKPFHQVQCTTPLPENTHTNPSTLFIFCSELFVCTRLLVVHWCCSPCNVHICLVLILDFIPVLSVHCFVLFLQVFIYLLFCTRHLFSSF